MTLCVPYSSLCDTDVVLITRLQLVSKALQFLTAVSKNRKHAEHFNSENVLEQIVEKIILPNMSLRSMLPWTAYLIQGTKLSKQRRMRSFLRMIQLSLSDEILTVPTATLAGERQLTF